MSLVPGRVRTSTSMKVLVVAADPRDARFASRVLEDRGDYVEVADSVPSAVSTLGRGDVDIALVSLSLPRGDGLALVHHLRALYPLVDVICLTTTQDLEETTHAMALGVLQTIMRPLTGDALLVAVDRARERRILMQERKRLDVESRQDVGAAAIETGPERGFAHRDAPHLGQGFVVVGGPRDHVDVGIDVVHESGRSVGRLWW